MLALAGFCVCACVQTRRLGAPKPKETDNVTCACQGQGVEPGVEPGVLVLVNLLYEPRHV